MGMNFNEFLESLNTEQITFLVIATMAVLWAILHPYYSLSRLKDIDGDLSRIATELKEIKEEVKQK